MLKAIKKNTRDFGRPTKLSRADQLLMTLMCWREYRTEFNIGVSYGISGSALCRIIKKNEDALIESEISHLSGGKDVSCRSDLKTVLIDASEQPAGHPKKRVSLITAEKKCFTQKVQTAVDLRQEKFFLLIFAMEERMISDCSTNSGAAVQPHVLILTDAGCSENCRNSQKQRFRLRNINYLVPSRLPRHRIQNGI